ncbi:MAG TPA: excinuclease ABC subunit A, partial [Geoalkalibacter subterraneus]|nr:excinuclease ABC subunit A [Geoalkalibacter subterraneus]
LRCPDCDGRRFRPEILEIKVHGADGGAGKSIANVLEMTVSEALRFFADRPEVLRGLEPLEAVGLDYLSLGQPVPTLSGGEAQRLKLAGHLSATQGRKRKSRKGMLFLFDEPTTGLHFDDIARLLKALRRLESEGHSLLIIEHNLDVIAAADWLIDLGPEGGEGGGRIICAGSPLEVMECKDSHTGLALRQYLDQQQRNEASARLGKRGLDQGEAARFPSPDRKQSIDRQICVHGAREHNLKEVNVCLPRDAFTVITGVSGSGKSTLAFDILFAEGQRRYLESLNAYARQFVQPSSRPDIDALSGIPPTVAIEQRTSRGGRKSTVATLTEIYHFLRLLYVKLGVQYCPECNIPIEPQSHEAIVARLLRDFKGQEISLLAPLVVGRKGYYTDLAKWAAGKGFSHLRVDGVDTPTDSWPRLDRFREHNIDLPAGDVKVTAENEKHLRERLHRALDYGKGVVKVALDGSGTQSRDTIFSTRRACPDCGRGFEEPDPRLFSFNSKHGWCESCYGTGMRLAGFDEQQSGEEIWWNAWYEGEEQPCPVCKGTRLRPEALAVLFHGHNIAELTALSIVRAEEFFRDLSLKGREVDLARDIVAELESRFAFLREVGLSYLGLDRAAPTLSGGEAQRIRLAAQLGSNLRGVCYILDEPTIGLHPRDNRMLLDTLEKLEQKGNTIVVVEHDDETIRRAGHLIDLGPAAGINGGRIVAQGTVDDLMAAPESLTGQFLRTPLCHPLHKRRRVTQRSTHLEVKDARLHNLKGFDLRLPLERLVCVTGVSGSGKSTLVRSVLHDNLRRILAQKNKEDSPSWSGCREIKGWTSIHRILEVDQTPIGKTPRSCPATYVGFWDDVRKLFAGTAEAKMRGWGPGRFSFNTRDGRCPDCEGQGTRKIEMSFLPDVRIVCETCGGQRFTRETLAVTYKGRHIGDILKMTINQATEYFSAHKKIHHALRLLQDVGLGYLTLGQQSPTLSGGEAQRIKLVTELAKAPANGAPQGRSKGGRKMRGGPTLYILDEPTIGLHMADVEKLIRVLHRLVDAGNTVLLIEHNLDIIAEADWLVDMGPEGGEEGGSVVAQGTPEQVSRKEKDSHT